MQGKELLVAAAVGAALAAIGKKIGAPVAVIGAAMYALGYYVSRHGGIAAYIPVQARRALMLYPQHPLSPQQGPYTTVASDGLPIYFNEGPAPPVQLGAWGRW